VTGNITDVPLLVFNKGTKSFTLKKIVKNSTTLKVRSISNVNEKPTPIPENNDISTI